MLDGKREPEALSDILQMFVFGNIIPDIDWQKTYAALGMFAEYTEAVKVLGNKEDPGYWFVPVVKGVTCNKVVAILREAFIRVSLTVSTYVEDLDVGVPTNDRDPNRDGSYVVGFHRAVEADEENAGKSANTLKAEGHKGITLLERLLLELGYFLTTGRNLDIKNITLCAGSRCSDGSVPRVGFYSDSREVDVGWDRPGDSDDRLRSRSAVSSVIPPA